jgi:hypothetical protein
MSICVVHLQTADEFHSFAIDDNMLKIAEKTKDDLKRK